MDWINYANTSVSFIKKYRYPILGILAGILILAIPNMESNTPEQPATESQTILQPELEDALADILCLVEGAGRVEVLLTPAIGEETIYQTNADTSSNQQSSNHRSSTVLVTGEGRLETGLVKQVNPAVYRGALVVCEGAEDPWVRLSLVEAVMRVTGLTSDKITVLKMK